MWAVWVASVPWSVWCAEGSVQPVWVRSEKRGLETVGLVVTTANAGCEE